MKKFFIVSLTLVMGMVVFAACSNKEMEIQEEMDMFVKLRYAESLGFELRMHVDGQWFQGSDFRDFTKARAFVSPNSEFFKDFYTEVRFLHHSDETIDIPNTVIAVWPTENTINRAVTALNWEANSANLDLGKFGLAYPITIDNLVNDYEGVNRLLRHDEWLQLSLLSFVRTRVYDTRVEFELDRLGDWQSDDNTKKVLDILNQLNMSQDEGGPLLRTAGSLDRFIAVTDLMITQGLTAEQALRRVR